jgi:hypothetical protein
MLWSWKPATLLAILILFDTCPPHPPTHMLFYSYHRSEQHPLPKSMYININFLQDPMISKMILSANDFGCSDEILTIASFLSVQVRFCISDTIFLFLILF